MPIEHEGKTYYSEAEIKATYIPKSQHESIISERIDAKNRAIAGLEGQVLDLTSKVASSEPLLAELNGLKKQLSETQDREAFRAAGLLSSDTTPEAQKANADRIEFIRMAHRHHISKLDDKPANEDEHFRAWLTADDGAKASPFLGHMFQAAAPPAATPPAPAAPPATPPPEPPKPTGAPPLGTGTSDSSPSKVLTQEQHAQWQDKIRTMRRNIRDDASRAAYQKELAEYTEATSAG